MFSSFRAQKLEMFKYLCLIHATHIDPPLKKSIHISFNPHVSFQLDNDLIPKPVSSLGKQRLDQATLAPVEMSRLPCDRYDAERLFISFITFFGRKNAAVQNSTIPEITVESRRILPAKLKCLCSQLFTFLRICVIRGSQSFTESFRELPHLHSLFPLTEFHRVILKVGQAFAKSS